MNAEDFPGLAGALGQRLPWKAKAKEQWVEYGPLLLSWPGLLAVLAGGLVLGWAATRTRPWDARREFAGAERARSAGGAFEILLPRGWENLTEQANLGASSKQRRELVLRQKDRAGSRLLVVHSYEPGKSGPRSIDLLGSWIVGQKQEMSRLRKQSASFLPAPPAEAKGVPVEVFRLAGADPSGPETSAGTFVFKGDFYEFFYATSHPNDSELLLALLGSISGVKKSDETAKSGEKKTAKSGEKKAVKGGEKKTAKRARKK